uniref:Ig-like domain-containing protein n=1 Tax=Astyanax mexicanus TaxID=7994 RepID=A0A3B1J208_ASTMX
MKALSPLFILHSVHHSADHTDNMLPTLCVLLPALAWVSSQKVLTQTPSVLTEQQGKTISMDCNIAKYESNFVHWYKQIPQSAPQFVLSFYHSHSSPAEYGADFPSSRFTSKASSNIDYQLIISNVEVGDSAVYYCCTLNDSPISWVFGPGTKLIVTDSAVPPPVLSIFPPSSEELKSRGRFSSATFTSETEEVFVRVRI